MAISKLHAVKNGAGGANFEQRETAGAQFHRSM
jgi:hypothetical protein